MSIGTRYPEAGFDVQAVHRARELIRQIPDPEIPVISIEELGILRSVVWNEVDEVIDVTITPTYNGCPAMGQIEDDIRTALDREGIGAFRLRTVLAPAWTTDWMSTEAKAKLAAYGIAPPRGDAPHGVAAQSNVVQLRPKPSRVVVPCPQCGSHQTTETSPFGSTACKALYRCLSCMEPFDYFKPY